MAEALLAQMRIRKPPKAMVPVRVRAQRPKDEVVEQRDDATDTGDKRPKATRVGPRQILDKRKTAKFDRMAFMAAMGQATEIQPLPRAPSRASKKPVAPPAQPEAKPVDETEPRPEPSKPKPKRRLRLVPKRDRSTEDIAGPLSMLKIGDLSLETRLAARAPQPQIKAPAYYLNNREIFINFMTSLFGKYKKEMALVASSATCERKEGDEFQAMGHQKLVRDYLALYTPYRGLLLYHGLGAGKTCSSIAIAEGLKSTRKVWVMTPASLRTNYVEELKKCGDPLYRKNQHWEFVPVRAQPSVAATLAAGLGLDTGFIKKAGGAWLMNPTKASNFDSLDASSQRALDKQLDAMIKEKYQFLSYNGMRDAHLERLSAGYTKNPFDDSVVVIDEAHNFVSRIVNKLSKNKNDSLSVRMYNYLMDARNARIVLLTGTPIINYPNEIGIMFNIIRGKIQTWKFKLAVDTSEKVTEETIKTIFKSTVLGGNVMDYIEYRPTSSTLTVTRNPYGFVNKTAAGDYKGVRAADRGEMSDEDFVGHITKQLKKKGIRVDPKATQLTAYKALPDTAEDFAAYFLAPDAGGTKNMNLFKRRILGLASYFSDITDLMPRYNKSTDFHIVNLPMSDFQFGVYEEARIKERKLEESARLKAKKKKQGPEGVFEETVSTYRIFSRAFCNFVFPRPDIKRPMPGPASGEEGKPGSATEDILDAIAATEVDDEEGADETKEPEKTGSVDAEYQERVKRALEDLSDNRDKYLNPDALQTYSPKFLSILQNVSDPENAGPHLVYSQFRTLEGIGILRLVFLANGYAEFKLKRGENGWQMDVQPGDEGKPMFVLYTGTESAEEREMVRNAFNGVWGALPPGLAEELRAIHPDNKRGEVIKLLMITASGAEGISLKNVRYVHITEPYWHPVRIEQVIGRARRLCSHQGLPEAERQVEVFLYLMVFSEKQLTSDESIELRLKDKSKIDRLTPVTSDQHLYEVATMKADVTGQILQAIREASIDCALSSKPGDPNAPKCFTFGSPGPNAFSYRPSYAEEEADTVADRNKTTVEWTAKEVTILGIKYAMNPADNKLYDYDSYMAAAQGQGQPIQIGTLVREDGKFKLVRI